jgi:hypothetical protein
MSKDPTDRSNVVASNIVLLKLTDLLAEARAEIKWKTAEVQAMLLSQLTLTRNGTIIKHDNTPPIVIDDKG